MLPDQPDKEILFVNEIRQPKEADLYSEGLGARSKQFTSYPVLKVALRKGCPQMQRYLEQYLIQYPKYLAQGEKYTPGVFGLKPSAEARRAGHVLGCGS